MAALLSPRLMAVSAFFFSALISSAESALAGLASAEADALASADALGSADAVASADSDALAVAVASAVAAASTLGGSAAVAAPVASTLAGEATAFWVTTTGVCEVC